MKLHQTVINENLGPATFKLILSNIVKNGDVTDFAQIHVLALLSEFFKSGRDVRKLEGPVPYSNDATQNDVVDAIKSLSPSDKVKLAQHLIDAIDNGSSPLHDNTQGSADWIRFVLMKQD
jgi:hypothetical protein